MPLVTKLVITSKVCECAHMRVGAMTECERVCVFGADRVID